MSFAVDANLLLYASDLGSEHHERALQFFRDCAAGTETVYLPWPTVMAYLRVATHPRIFEQPLRPEDATANVERLLAQPNVRALSEGPDFWKHYRALADAVPLRGNLVPDAHIVAILLSNGVGKLFSRDRDFRKFDGVRVVDPLGG